jgi:hypothetical protein
MISVAELESSYKTSRARYNSTEGLIGNCKNIPTFYRDAVCFFNNYPKCATAAVVGIR